MAKERVNQNEIQTCQLVNAERLGQLLKLSKRQIFRLRSSGKLPAPIRLGGSIRWMESTIIQWLRAGAPDRKTFDALQHQRGES